MWERTVVLLGWEASGHTCEGRFHQQRSSDDHVRGQPVAAGSFCSPQRELALLPPAEREQHLALCVPEPPRELFFWGRSALPAKSKAVGHSAPLQLGLVGATQLGGGGGLPLEVQAEKDLEILAPGLATTHTVNFDGLSRWFLSPLWKSPINTT